MKDKHPIDSFFNDKLADRQIPFKEEYWNSALDMIEADSARKRKRFLWLFLFLGLLLGTSLFLYTGMEVENVPSQRVETQTRPVEDQAPVSILEDGVEGLAEKGKSQVGDKLPNSFAKILKQSNFDREAESTGNSRKNEKFVQPDLSHNLKAQEELLSENTGNYDEKNESTQFEELAIEDAVNKRRVLNSMQMESPEDGDIKSSDFSTEQISAPEKKYQVKAEKLDLKYCLLISNEFYVPKKRYPFAPRTRRNQVGFEFGFAVNEAMAARNSGSQSMGMSPVLGLSFQRELSRSLSLRTGLRYVQMPALSGDSTFISTSFSFGEEIQGINIRALALHQIEVPLQLRFAIGPRSHISVGTYARYLLNVQSEVARFESNPFESLPGPVQKEWGYKQGFKNFDAGVQLGYQYHLSEALQIGAELQYGLIDVRRNSFYRENFFDRNLSARIVLSYDFFQFN